MQTPGGERDERFYSIDDVSPDVESRQRKRRTPPQFAPKRSLVSPFPKRDFGRNPQLVRVTLCAAMFVILILSLAIALGVSMSSHPSSNEDPPPTSSGSLAQTRRPTMFACSQSNIVAKFPAQSPMDFTVRLTMSDLCLNYPELDCQSLGTSYSSLNGAEMLDNNLWYFSDLVVYRVRQVDYNVEIRLEVVHAHDPERDTRGFVYTMYLRESDYCLVGFEVKQVVAVLMDAGNAYCTWDMAQTVNEAAQTSELVRRFVTEPTKFLSRLDDKWVFTSQATTAGTTTAATVGNAKGNRFLLSLPTTEENRPAAFLVSEQRHNRVQVMIALENDYLPTDSPQCRTAQTTLAPRSSLVFPDGSSSGNDNELTGCALDCDSNGGVLQDVVECINTCVAAQQDNAQVNTPPAIMVQQRVDEHRRLSPVRTAITASSSADTNTDADAAVDGESDYALPLRTANRGLDVIQSDDRMLECSKNKTTYQPGEGTLQQTRLIQSLEALLAEVVRLESRLTELIPLWNTAAGFNWNVVETNRLVYFDALDMRDRFLASVNQVRQMKRTTALAEVKDQANLLHQDFSLKYTQWFAFWDEYFTQVGGSIGLAQLNLVHLSSELLQVRQMRAALESYMIPIFSTTAAYVQDDGEQLAQSASILVSQSASMFARVELDYFNIEQIANSYETGQHELALNAMANESALLVQVLNANLVNRLEPALGTKVTQTFMVTQRALQSTAQLLISQSACESLQLACSLPKTCSVVSNNLVQVFPHSDSFTSTQLCVQGFNASAQLCSNTNCQVTGNAVYLPNVAVRSRTVDLGALLQDPGAAEEYAPVLLTALLNWPLFPQPESPNDFAGMPITNAEEILKQVVAAYSPVDWLPKSCLSDKFQSREVMLCPEVSAVTLALHLCEITSMPTTLAPVITNRPSTLRPGTQYPTAKPVPTKTPTFPKPSMNPTEQPTWQPTLLPTLLPTNKPTLPVPTRSPTLQPSMSPVTPFTCQWPSKGCPSIANQPGCDGYTGCIWDDGSGVCDTIADCSDFDCNIKLLAFVQGGRQLPGCRLGNLDECEYQRMRMFTTLKLGSKCGLKFVKTSDGGAWMGKETSFPPTPLGDVFVSSDVGEDDGINAIGTRAKPFRTLQRAVDETRRSSKRNITVLAGTYRLNKPLQFSPADNGLSIVGEGLPKITATVSLQNVQWERWGVAGIIRAPLSSEILDQVDTLSQLFVNDQAGVRARFPNLQNRLGFKYMSATSSVKTWATMTTIPNPTSVISKVILPSDVTDPNKLQYSPLSIPYNRFSLGYGGLCSHFTNKASYFCDPNHYAQGGCKYSLPTGVTMKTKLFNLFYSSFSTKSKNIPYFHTLHWWGWGLWTFSVAGMTADKITFGPGGWQEARGDCKKGGGDWYLENMKVLLDFPNEYFLDRDEGYIYYYPETNDVNPMLNPGGVQLELGSSTRTLFSFTSSNPALPIRNILLRGLDFFGTYPSLMDEHEVPGGGDWTFVRQATVKLENVEDALVQECKFRKIGGNALLVSKHARRIRIERSEFYALGSTAVILAGDPGFDTNEPWVIKNYPANVTVFGNVMSYFGLVVKQAAGVFVALSKDVDILENVMHSSPRGGLVLNDGFGGNVRMARNTLFEHVLETNDHGIVNCWDRQQFIEPFGPKQPFVVEENLLLGTAKGPKGIDLDDGAFNYLSRNNVLVWGYQKFKGSHIVATGNLILYPLESSCVFITPPTRNPAFFDYSNNVCVSWKLAPYAYNMSPAEIRNACLASNFASYNNTFYIGGLGTAPKFDGCSPGTKYSFQVWQSRYGQDTRSTQITKVPDYLTIEGWIVDKLPWVAAANAVVANRRG
ncbi:hypothetical protein BASA81_003101 [Batrachochytrium salamandrivorans]|nr:hypothetical protein BASA81_003101 [Batrachochytrium salamandrivorans]